MAGTALATQASLRPNRTLVSHMQRSLPGYIAQGLIPIVQAQQDNLV